MSKTDCIGVFEQTRSQSRMNGHRSINNLGADTIFRQLLSSHCVPRASFASTALKMPPPDRELRLHCPVMSQNEHSLEIVEICVYFDYYKGVFHAPVYYR